MQHHIKSIRTFIGAKDYNLSRRFYELLGFEESVISDNMSYLGQDGFGFYLQDAYVKQWVDNSMIFLEVANTVEHRNHLLQLNLIQLKNVRISPIVENAWGKEYFVHDPSGVLWHFGEFY